MPLTGPADPLPHRPLRVVVAGTSGAGKTTLAGRIAAVLTVPHVELDSLFHGPGWTPRPSFVEDVRAFTAGPAWVTEWQYRSVRSRLAERADLMVWMDLPTPVVMRQVVRRSVARRMRRERLWNGNVEPPLRTVLTDPEHVIRWAWSTRHRTAQQVGTVLREHPGLTVVRLGSHVEARHWLQGPLRRALRPPGSPGSGGPSRS
ncbi:ATPase AAA [Actinotalea ferrariae CF5-4]|uniref:ATPase AAA n=1 Tax=Actinotalea ferrariae CF5-4 TaxID=948458 RepID=A0A021VQ25_9CELL|nr:AAA family ATPase [Actinotalea ferrariae]EYR63251.1 ATPase AAA [Actinotalea ferrariae CF5-4]